MPHSSLARHRFAKFAIFAALAVACTTKVVNPPASAPPDSDPQDEQPDAAPSSEPTKPDGSGNSSEYGSLAVSKPAPDRVVAIGDLHGDLDSTRRALKLAGAIDDSDQWIGGKLVVVQTGDTVDRGDDDRKIVDLIERLKKDAAKAGGEFVAMVGNHEIMNSMLDFRYVTEGGFSAFADVQAANDDIAKLIAPLDDAKKGRAAAFSPGGPYAMMLSSRPAVARVGDSIFVHGGVLPKWAKSLDATNTGVHDWLSGKLKTAPDAFTANDGPLWTRDFSDGAITDACAELEDTLGKLNAKRMVMGHTVQDTKINAACGEKAWRIDVGMSSYYGGPIEVLELRGDTLKVLGE
jgi:hypothetical protein